MLGGGPWLCSVTCSPEGWEVWVRIFALKCKFWPQDERKRPSGHHNIVIHPLGKMNINRKYHSFSLDINFSFSLLEFVSDDGTRAKVRELPKSLKIISHLGTMSVHAKSKCNGFISCQELLFWVKSFSYDTDINMLLFIHTFKSIMTIG